MSTIAINKNNKRKRKDESNINNDLKDEFKDDDNDDDDDDYDIEAVEDDSSNSNTKPCHGCLCGGNKYYPISKFTENGIIYKTCNECRKYTKERRAKLKKHSFLTSDEKICWSSLCRGRKRHISHFMENGMVYTSCNDCRKSGRKRNKRLKETNKCKVCYQPLEMEWVSGKLKVRCKIHLEESQEYMQNTHNYVKSQNIVQNSTEVIKGIEKRKYEIENGKKKCGGNCGQEKFLSEFGRFKKGGYTVTCLVCLEKAKISQHKNEGFIEYNPISY